MQRNTEAAPGSLNTPLLLEMYWRWGFLCGHVHFGIRNVLFLCRFHFLNAQLSLRFGDSKLWMARSETG